MSNKTVPEIVDDLITLQNNYATTYRFINTLERYEALISSKIIDKIDYSIEATREPLIEHVGHLPIIAVYLHQYVEHKKNIDLGEVLTMLAVHDIGETEVGDVFAFSKVSADEDAERKAAKKILPPYLYKYFEEFEKSKTINSKFAKSCDSIAPALHTLSLPPKIALERSERFGYNLKDIATKKSHYEWDSVLSEVFDYIFNMFKNLVFTK